MAFNQIIGFIKERGDIDKAEEKYIPHEPSCSASAAAVQLTFDNMFGKLAALARTRTALWSPWSPPMISALMVAGLSADGGLPASAGLYIFCGILIFIGIIVAFVERFIGVVVKM